MKSPPSWPALYKGAISGICSNPQAAVSAVTELCQTLGANTRRDFEGTSLDTLRQMVVMGMGITFLPALYVASEIRETDPLRVADVFGVNMYRDHALAWRSRSPARPLFIGCRAHYPLLLLTTTRAQHRPGERANRVVSARYPSPTRYSRQASGR